MRLIRRRVAPGAARPLIGPPLLAALTVLLPLLGRCVRAATFPAAAAMGCGASATLLGFLLTARLSPAPERALVALGGAQAAFHLGYTLPAAYGAGAGHPSWEVTAGHAVTVALAARLLGVAEVTLRPLRTLAAAARQRLALRLPGPVRALGRLPLVPVGDPGRTAVAFRAPPRRGERAPPHRRVIPRVPLSLRPVPGGGACPV